MITQPNYERLDIILIEKKTIMMIRATILLHVLKDKKVKSESKFLLN